MKKILIITAFAFMTFNSCKKDAPFFPVDRQDNMAVSAATSAIMTDIHFDFPGPYDLVNQCTGEAVTVTGTIGDDIHIVINGGTMNFSEHQQGHLRGTGSLGNKYVTNLNENVTLNGIPNGNGLFVIEDITIFRMVSSGGTPNFTVRRNAHLTVTANGEVTVDRIDFDVLCHG